MDIRLAGFLTLVVLCLILSISGALLVYGVRRICEGDGLPQALTKGTHAAE